MCNTITALKELRLKLLLLAILGLFVFTEAQVMAQEDLGSQLGSSRSSRSRSGSGGGTSLSSRNSNLQSDTEQSRSERSRDRTRDRNSGQSGSRGRAGAKGSPTPAAGAPAGAAGKDLKTVKGKTPAAKQAGGGSPARAVTTIEFKMKANPNTNLLFVEGVGADPTLNIIATEGKNFTTRIGLENPRGTPFDKARISVKYDPAIIKPLGVDDSSLEGLLEGDSSATVDNRRGIITFGAEFSETRRDATITMFKIEWQAIAPTSNSTISFLNSSRNPTAVVSAEGVNVLHQRDDDGQVEASEKAGLLDAALAVAPSASSLRSLKEDDQSFSAISLANSISAGTAEGGIILKLQPRKDSAQVGKDFLVDVLYENPKRAELDTIKLKVNFDPHVLQVVDHDEDNWITRDINIFDGDYHEDLPFDYHRKNVAMNSTGSIHYDMGFATRVQIPGRGIIATIKFRPVAPANATQITFGSDSTTEEGAQTSISFLGFNLIGTPGARASALQNTVLAVDEL